MSRTKKSNEFIRAKFAEYYRNAELLSGPPDVERREFGFFTMNKNMIRHLRFTSKDELRSFLASAVPSDAYFSCAYYEKPEANMDEKGWLGADLVFDIDADHIPTNCSKLHDNWTCTKCGFDGKGITPDCCPVCGGDKFDTKTWPCEVCVESAKEETMKLLDILARDFGFSDKEIHVFFSGHRGYHVHIESETIRTLGSVARKEIVDYVCGLGFDTVFQSMLVGGSGKSDASRDMYLDSAGWRGRLARGIYEFIQNAGQNDYLNLRLRGVALEAFVNRKDEILKKWTEAGSLVPVKGIGFKTWSKIVEYCKRSQSSSIDTIVTTDNHRLIRMADALHGKTGLRKMEFPASSIVRFDPFKAAIVFKEGTVTVLVSDAPKFSLGDGTYGPYKDERVELPTAAAMLLVCKGRAEVVD